MIASYADGTETPLYALLNGGLSFGRFPEIRSGLRDLASWTDSYEGAIAPRASRTELASYPGSRHGALVVDALSASPGLTDFLNSQLSDDPAWATVEQ